MSIFIYQDKRDEFVVYYPSDEAIDAEKSDLEAYASDGDASHLVFIPGKKPSRFIFRPLSHAASRKQTRMYLSVSDESDRESALVGLDALAFMFKSGLVRVETDDEIPPALEEIFAKRNRDGLSDDVLNYFPPNVVIEVGGVAVSMSQNNKKK